MAEVTGGYNKTINFRDSYREIDFLADKIEKWSSALKNDLTDEMTIGVNQIRNIIIKSMQGTDKDTTKFYIRGGKKHFPSREGNPPAIDTGNLLRSILVDSKSLSVEVGSIQKNPPYGSYLEFGTDRMEKRPWLQPAVDGQKDDISQRLINRLAREFES